MTNIPAGHESAVRHFTVKTFGKIVQASNWLARLTGPMDDGQTEAQGKLEGRTIPGMPVVRIGNLKKQRGDAVQLTLFDTINGEPIMGSRNLEGKGESLWSSSVEMKINQMAKVVNAGDEMSQQRVIYELLPIAHSQLKGWFPRAYNQVGQVHLFGSRGVQTGMDWVLPLASAATFDDILVNPVLAPTYNRHLVIDGSGFVQGGAQLGSVDSTDVWTLDHIDELSTRWDLLEYPMQPVRVPGDMLSDDDPIKGLLYLTPKQHQQITTANSGRNWSDMVKNAFARKTPGMTHPLFNGEVGLWRGILVKQLPHRHYCTFTPGATTKTVAVGDRYVTNRNNRPTETTTTVNGSLTAGFQVERAMFLGAQALGYAMGRAANRDFYFDLRTRMYNFDLAEEIAGIATMGMQKLQFVFRDSQGRLEPTDHGVMVIDSVVKQ